MSGATRHAEAQERVDALRRRLYRSDATEEDLRRYLAERDADSTVEPTTRQEAAAPRRRRLLLPALVLIALVASGTGLALTPQHPTTPPTPSARAAAPDAAFASVVAVAGTLAADPASPAVRRHVSRRTTADGGTVLSQRFDGSGATVVPLDLTTAPFDGGRAVVMLTTSRRGPDGWRAVRVRTRRDWSSYAEVVARGPSTDDAGIPFATIAPYDGSPPGWIAVDAARDVRWRLEVMFLPPIANHPDCTDLRSCVDG